MCGTAIDDAPGSVASVTITSVVRATTGTGTGLRRTRPPSGRRRRRINLTVTGTTSWNRALTTASLQNGVTYTVVAIATDGVGLTGTDTHAFVYDTTNPTGTITAPTNSANVDGTSP